MWTNATVGGALIRAMIERAKQLEKRFLYNGLGLTVGELEDISRWNWSDNRDLRG